MAVLTELLLNTFGCYVEWFSPFDSLFISIDMVLYIKSPT